MRKILLTSFLAVAAAFSAQAGDSPNGDLRNDAQARLYANFSFGGSQKALKNSFHYGLKLDYGQSLAQSTLAPRPSMLQLDFDRHGLAETRVSGLNVVRRLMLNQDEGSPAPEESGSSGESSSGEPSTSYSAIDWALVAVGVVGIGFVAVEVLGTDERTATAPAAAAAEDDPLLGCVPGLGCL